MARTGYMVICTNARILISNRRRLVEILKRIELHFRSFFSLDLFSQFLGVEGVEHSIHTSPAYAKC